MKKKNIKVIVKSFGWLCNLIVRLAFLLISLAIIVLASYYFGNVLLLAIRGGDAASNISIISWFDHWYPKLPLWYPLQGGGVSLVYGYHFLAHLMGVVVSRISGIGLENAYQVLGFVSVPLISMGIYLYVWTRLKNQTVALVASLFYFLSPITWVWLFDWGFFGESVSYIFIPLTLIFFDLFLTSVLERKNTFKTRLWFVLAVISLSVLWITHALGFLGIFFFFPFFGLFYSLLYSKKERFKNVIRGLTAVFAFFVFTYLLASFHEMHFQYYSFQAGNAGSASEEFFFKDASEWYFLPFLGLEDIPIENRRHAEQNVAFPAIIWAMALVGLVSAFIFRSKKLLVIGIFSVLNFLFIFYPAPVWRILNLTGAQHYRPLIIPLRIFMPILAAFGVACVPQLVWSIIFWWKRFLGKNLAVLVGSVRSLLIAVSTLVLALVVVMLFRYYSNAKVPAVRYGPGILDFEMIDDSDWPYLCPTDGDFFSPKLCNLSRKPDLDKKAVVGLCNIYKSETHTLPPPEFCANEPSEGSFNLLVDKCNSGTMEGEYLNFCDVVVRSLNSLLDINSWPKLRLEADMSVFDYEITRKFLEVKEGEKPVRIDVSPNQGGITQSFNLNNYSDSMLNLWGYQSSLNHSYWGNQQNVYYGKGEKSSASVYNVAKWFGTKYILLNTMDPVKHFEKDPDNWEFVDEEIVSFKPDVGLHSFSTDKPVVLVIGSKKLGAYETFFRLANEGVLSYDDAFLVMGEDRIDSYSLSELRDFDALVLFGYSYKNMNKAFKTLDRYVQEGGRIFLSTGWQFFDKDWEIEKAPEFFPVDSLSWSADLSTNSEYKLEDKEIKNVNPKKFGSFSWAGKPWGVSVPSEVRSWAKTLLSVDDYPLVVVGDYGEGKVLWSGFNFMGHISAYDNNPEEIKFLKSAFELLFDKEISNEVEQTKKVELIRDYPDEVEFIFRSDFEPGALYFRESYHLDWKAIVISGNRKESLPIYRSGPMYKLVMTPEIKVGDRVVFRYSNGIRGLVANLVSLITLIVMIIYLVVGLKVFKPIGKFSDSMVSLLKTKLHGVIKWEEE